MRSATSHPAHTATASARASPRPTSRPPLHAKGRLSRSTYSARTAPRHYDLTRFTTRRAPSCAADVPGQVGSTPGVAEADGVDDPADACRLFGGTCRGKPLKFGIHATAEIDDVIDSLHVD